MLNELDRMILEAVLAAEEPIPSKKLAQKCNVAINTIRKEIALINVDAVSHGFQIASKASQGYYVEVTDAQLAPSYLEDLLYHLKRSRFAEVTYPSQIYYLVRRLLCTEQGLAVESLCRELYCSKTTLMKDLKQVRELLANYDLTLKKKRGGYGLYVEGNEWNIRQCLIFHHKIYQLFWGEREVNEAEFRAQFMMHYGQEYTNELRRRIHDCLANQRNFTIPMIHIPKIMNIIRLSVTRAKHRDEMSFAAEQTARAKDTPEYKTAWELHVRLAPHEGAKIYEADVLATTMLLMSYETQNHRLREIPEYSEYVTDLDELLVELRKLHPSLTFDEEFREDFTCHLYVLRNRRAFHVFADPEQTGSIRRSGRISGDLCLQFARFYQKKYGIVLHKQNTMKAFYCFNRLLKEEQTPFFFAQDILVISRYGIDCARSMAIGIQVSYGPRVRRITACEFLEYPDDMEEYNLLITDSGESHVRMYGLPVITMDYAMRLRSRIPELDRYLDEVCVRGEWLLIGADSFYRANLRSKEGVFEFVSGLMAQRGCDQAEILAHLKENDALIDQERGDGFALLPILLENVSHKKFVVVVNQAPLRWNEGMVQAFVCYPRTGDEKISDIQRNVLIRLMKVSRDEIKDWAAGKTMPMDTLYSPKDKKTD